MPLNAKRRRAAAARAGRTLGLLAGIGLIGAVVSCTDKGRSLVLVDISVDPAVATVASVRAVVVQAQSAIGENDASWKSSPVELGVYLAKTVSGSVQVLACGFDATGAGVAAAAGMSVTVQAGATAGPVAVMLTAGAPSALCGAGTSGTGGAGGGAVGNGGSGGAAGQPGTGGSASGTGGAQGGTTGTGGAGGMGTGGAKGGTTGSGGAGGTGTGGIGTGGAGTGGTGTGGSGGPSWSNAVGVGGPATAAQLNPAVAVDPSGNAVVVFENGNAIYANHYDSSQNSWGTPTPLETRTSAYGPKVAVDKNGIYVAIWAITNDATYDGIWESSSSDGVNWSNPPTPLTTTNAFSAALSMNADGDAVAAWTESVNNNWQVAAAIRAGGNNPSWGSPTVLLPSTDDGDRNPAAAMSGTGEAFVGWEQGDGTTNDINSVWMAQYTSGAWGNAFVFDDDASAASTVSIAANKNGSAIATYTELTSTYDIELWSRRYTPVNGFAAALEVTEANIIDGTTPPALVLDDSGVATVAWNVEVGGTDYEVHASRAAANATAWPTETPLETDDTAAQDDPNSYNIGQATMPLLGCDSAGNVTLLWRKRTAASGVRFDLVSRRFTVGGTWNPQVPVESMDALSVFWPALGVGTNGTAVAAWEYTTDTSSSAALWTSVFH
ncbi:MAG TPA: hypothetical protein VN853_14100 [Polyangia bacterium]|nr:hypothetical protein [Polyangia bacterium]